MKLRDIVLAGTVLLSFWGLHTTFQRPRLTQAVVEDLKNYYHYNHQEVTTLDVTRMGELERKIKEEYPTVFHSATDEYINLEDITFIAVGEKVRDNGEMCYLLVSEFETKIKFRGEIYTLGFETKRLERETHFHIARREQLEYQLTNKIFYTSALALMFFLMSDRKSKQIQYMDSHYEKLEEPKKNVLTQILDFPNQYPNITSALLGVGSILYFAPPYGLIRDTYYPLNTLFLTNTLLEIGLVYNLFNFLCKTPGFKAPALPNAFQNVYTNFSLQKNIEIKNNDEAIAQCTQLMNHYSHKIPSYYELQAIKHLLKQEYDSALQSLIEFSALSRSDPDQKSDFLKGIAVKIQPKHIKAYIKNNDDPFLPIFNTFIDALQYEKPDETMLDSLTNAEYTKKLSNESNFYYEVLFFHSLIEIKDEKKYELEYQLIREMLGDPTLLVEQLGESTNPVIRFTGTSHRQHTERLKYGYDFKFFPSMKEPKGEKNLTHSLNTCLSLNKLVVPPFIQEHLTLTTFDFSTESFLFPEFLGISKHELDEDINYVLSMRNIVGETLHQKLLRGEYGESFYQAVAFTAYLHSYFDDPEMEHLHMQPHLEERLHNEDLALDEQIIQKIIDNFQPLAESYSWFSYVPNLDEHPEQFIISEEGITKIDNEKRGKIPRVVGLANLLYYEPSIPEEVLLDAKTLYFELYNANSNREDVQISFEHFEIGLLNGVIQRALQLTSAWSSLNRTSLASLRPGKIGQALDAITSLENKHATWYQNYCSQYQNLREGLHSIQRHLSL